MQENFRDKYTQTNVITRLLLQRFFASTEALLPPGINSVLEIGCAEGHATQQLRRMLPASQYTAFDVDPALVTAASANNADSGIEFLVASAYAIPRASASADLCIIMEVLEHLEHPEAALAEVARVSRRHILATVPWEPWWRLANMARGKYWRDFGNTPGHINHWSHASFLRLAAGAGRIVAHRISFPWSLVLIEKHGATA